MDRGLAAQILIWSVGLIAVAIVASSIIAHPPTCSSATSRITNKTSSSFWIPTGQGMGFFSTDYYFALANGKTVSVDSGTYARYSVGQNYTYSSCGGA